MIKNTDINEFNNIFQELGFDLSDKSGGQFLEIIPSITKNKSGLYETKTFDGEQVLFLEADTFLRTVNKTEEQLNVKLFI